VKIGGRAGVQNKKKRKKKGGGGREGEREGKGEEEKEEEEETPLTLLQEHTHKDLKISHQAQSLKVSATS
jgi:hypothetical protein